MESCVAYKSKHCTYSCSWS